MGEPMDEWLGWVLAIVGAAAVGVATWVGRTLTKLPLEYVPRDQLNSRFESIRAEMRDDTQTLEKRNDKRFDSIDGKLDRILDKMDTKVDKQPPGG